MTQAISPRRKEAQAIIRHYDRYKCFSGTNNAHTETLRVLTLTVESVDSWVQSKRSIVQLILITNLKLYLNLQFHSLQFETNTFNSLDLKWF